MIIRKRHNYNIVCNTNSTNTAHSIDCYANNCDTVCQKKKKLSNALIRT